MTTKIRKLYAVSIVLVAVMMCVGCKKEEQVVLPKVFKIAPTQVQLTYGDYIELKATLDDKEVKASWLAVSDGIVSIDENGKVKALKIGKCTVTATYETYSATAEIEVVAMNNVELFLPHLRFFDDKQSVLDYETALGHTLTTQDEAMQYYMFATKSTSMPQVGYLLGQAIQIYASKEVLTSEKFIQFMASKGFVTDGKVLYGYYVAYTSPFSTVNAFAVVDKVPGNDQMATGMCFTVKNPKLSAMPYPVTDWSSTPQAIESYEKSRGYKLTEKRTDDKGRTEYIFGKKTEYNEFTEVFVQRYLFSKDNQLIKSTTILVPAQYAVTPLGSGAFSMNDEFKTLITSDGYVEKPMASDPQRKIYGNSSKNNKFTVRTWNLTINGHKYVGAGFDFVPYNGPDEIE